MKKVKCEIYSRVCGYFAPINRWNAGKQEEFRERQTYSPARSLDHDKTVDWNMRSMIVEEGVLRS